MTQAFYVGWNILKGGVKDALHDMMIELDRMLRFNEQMSLEEAAALVAKQHPEWTEEDKSPPPPITEGSRTTGWSRGPPMGERKLALELMFYYRSQGGESW